jgi:excisionase family DNA binding protein
MKFLTCSEFANRLNISCQTVRDMIKTHKIHAVRPGNGKRTPYRIPDTEFERLIIASQCEKT